MSGNIFRISSIDGGGIRGVFPAHILNCISSWLGISIADHFNMIAGTSTGSIVAAAIACKIEPGTIVSLYREYGAEIFTSKWSCLPKKCRPAFHSVYDSRRLSEILKDILGDIKLGEISIPLLLPSTDIGLGGVHVFKSNYSKEFTRDKGVLLREAVLASCSAPTFFNPVKVGEYLLADGGLWANNPSLAAVIDAQQRLNVKLDDIRILSIGTGLAKTSYDVKINRLWGLISGWKGRQFINFLMSLQAQSTHNYLQFMLGKDQLLRLNFESDLQLPLDDCSTIEDMISRADKVFTYKSGDLKKFFDID